MMVRAERSVQVIARGHPALLFATLMLGMMGQALAFTAFAPALPQMARDLGEHGQLAAQMSMALAALGVMIGSLPIGWILEKTGTRSTMLAGLLAYGAAGAGGLVLRDATLLLATRFMVGFAAACVVTTTPPKSGRGAPSGPSGARRGLDDVTPGNLTEDKADRAAPPGMREHRYRVEPACVQIRIAVSCSRSTRA
jgi:hypothetical protein